ncbi:MAG: glutamine amidotransferase [Halothiobacillaceae bacterium]|nr:MAG: glutamine amidotransferase [Halothiobacillaceae bacterium]
MKPVLIFRHLAHEGPGYCAQFLEQRAIPYQLICIDRGEPVPEHLDNASGLIFMGGAMSVNDPLPWIAQELRLIRLAHARHLPVLGHCLGGQLIAKALGGVVTPNPVKEIGWLPVQHVTGPAAQYWLPGLPAEFTVFHWHGETFSVPVGAELILRSAECAHQAFVIGKMLAMQCHVEMTSTMVRSWAEESPAELAVTSSTVQSAAEITRDADQRCARLHAVAEVLYGQWVKELR